MATIYPSRLSFARKIPKGERKVFAFLKDSLPDDFIVFHDRNMPLKNGARALNEHCIDFLVIKKGKGMLALEVKGAGIYNDGNGHLIQQWTRFGKQNSKSIDPIGQAQAQLHSLLRAFEKKTGLSISFASVAACAVFPDTSKRKFYGDILPPQSSEYIFEDDLPQISEIIQNYISDLTGSFPDAVSTQLVELLIKAQERGIPSSNREEIDEAGMKKIASRRTEPGGQSEAEGTFSLPPNSDAVYVSDISAVEPPVSAQQVTNKFSPKKSNADEKIDIHWDYYSDIFSNNEPIRTRTPKKKSRISKYEVVALGFLLAEILYVVWKYGAHMFPHYG